MARLDTVDPAVATGKTKDLTNYVNNAAATEIDFPRVALGAARR